MASTYSPLLNLFIAALYFIEGTTNKSSNMQLQIKINKDGIIVPEEEKEVVEVNKDLADKLVESMTTSDEDKDIMTKKIMEQYGLEPGNDQSGLEDEEDPINEY